MQEMPYQRHKFQKFSGEAYPDPPVHQDTKSARLIEVCKRSLKGLWNEKIGLKQTLLFRRTFAITNICLYRSRVSHFSLEIFGFVWYDM